MHRENYFRTKLRDKPYNPCDQAKNTAEKQILKNDRRSVELTTDTKGVGVRDKLEEVGINTYTPLCIK